ncbi:hypothetical protein [Bordetella sp. LUAb4]|uniref:hypothetical protein n=1 Tax=Bordetella sp. LUAb4 TaxID=2843195 RepID=UPI00351D4FD6
MAQIHFARRGSLLLCAQYSDSNKQLIKGRAAPVVDEVWVRYFPEHKDYLGSGLVHHHLDYGPMAIPLPKDLHGKQPGWGVWHLEHKGE